MNMGSEMFRTLKSVLTEFKQLISLHIFDLFDIYFNWILFFLLYYADKNENVYLIIAIP